MSQDRKKPGAANGRDGAEGDEAFLQRWSRRKAQARRGEPSEPEAAEPTTDAPEGRAAVSETEADAPVDEASLSDAELAERFGLPNPSVLEKDSDYSAFMRRGVPDRLRTAALRQLWRLSPDIGGVDDLLEYGEDFSDLGAGVVQTAYEVGSGFAKRIEAWEREQAEKERLAQEAAQEAAQDSAASSPETAETADAEADARSGAGDAPDDDPVAARPIAAPDEDLEGPDSPVQDAPLMTRRRMKFRFET